MKLLALLLALAPAASAARLVARDAGGFEPSGRTIEFPERFGWRSYEVEFAFELDEHGALTRRSRLEISIVKRSGARWRWTCKASRGDLTARLASVPGRQTVTAECRVPPKAFAKGVDLHPDDVGAPSFVYEAVLEGGAARPGAQKGLRFRPDVPVAAVELAAFAGAPDAGGLALAFSGPPR